MHKIICKECGEEFEGDKEEFYCEDCCWDADGDDEFEDDEYDGSDP
jgi:Zn finger protein HypA/HybF involved in hydrogenase expression